jgi:hypothetical protein
VAAEQKKHKNKFIRMKTCGKCSSAFLLSKNHALCIAGKRVGDDCVILKNE